MSQQEQNTASTKAFILELIDQEIRFHRWMPTLLKELKIRRQEVVEMLKGVEDE